MKSIRFIVVLLAVVILPLFESNAASPTPAPTPYLVKMNAFTFRPPTVHIKRNQTVRWVHRQALVTHDIDSDDGTTFASPDMVKGEVFRFKFKKKGRYPYHCNFHGSAGGHGMSGVIIVK